MNDSKRLSVNLAVGIAYQVVALFANFLTKQAVCSQLGTGYLGLQTVFANISDVLVFAFGGLGLAMAYQLYGPFSSADTKKQTAIFRHFNMLFLKVMAGAFVAGICSFGIVVWSVDVPIPLINIALAYALYLTGVVFGARYLLYYYFFMADQRRYIPCTVCLACEVMLTAAGVALLYAGCPYEAFLFSVLVKNLCITIVLRYYASRCYPYLNDPAEGPESSLRASIRRDVRDLIVTRAGTTLVTSTDSIIISGVVGTVVAGCYSAYAFTMAGINYVLTGIFEALMSHVGKMQTSETKRVIMASFIRMYCASLCLTAVCVSGFYWLVDDFIVLWMGSEVLLPNNVIIACTVNLYMSLFHYNVSAFRLSSGLFAGVSKVTLIRGSLNVILSLALGSMFGLVGILVATALSDAVTLYWYEPYVLYRHLECPFALELGFQATGVAVSLACLTVSGAVARHWGTCATWPAFFAKAIVVAVTACVACLPVFAAWKLVKRAMKGRI